MTGTIDSGPRDAQRKPGSTWSLAHVLFWLLLAGFAVFQFSREWQNGAFVLIAAALVLLEWRGKADAGATSPKDAARRSTYIAMAVVCAVTVLIYFPTLGMHFLADDFAYVQLYSHPSLENFLRLLTVDQSQGIWGYSTQEFRPMAGLSYMVDYWFSGINPVGYHITGLSLHVICALSIFGIARAAALGAGSAAFAGLLFGLLPIHTESVAWINGSKVEALPTMFYLVGFLGFVWFRATGWAGYLALASVGFISSLMSKEIAVTFPLMMVGYDVFRWAVSAQEIPRREKDALRRWKAIILPYIPIIILLAAYLTIRAEIFGDVLREGEWSFSVKQAFTSVAGFRAQFGGLWTKFASLQQYHAELLLGFPPVAIGVFSAVLITWLAFLIRPANADRNAMLPMLYFGVVWYVVACIPLLVTYHSPRHLYLPAAGPCIAVACLAAPGWNAISRRIRFTRRAGAVALLGILAFLLWRQNGNWIRAGEISESLSKSVPAAVEETPKQALVIALFPLDYNKALLWSWVFPFVLQEPFASRNLYAETHLLEFPEIYCCPVHHWWERKRPVLTAILSGDPEAQIEVHRLGWDEQSGSAARLRVTVPRKELRALIEGVIGNPESIPTISNDDATRLMWTLMNLTAKGESAQLAPGAP